MVALSRRLKVKAKRGQRTLMMDMSLLEQEHDFLLGKIRVSRQEQSRGVLVELCKGGLSWSKVGKTL